MARSYEEEQNNLNIIGNGTSINGDVASNGDLRIDGSLTGNLNTKSKLVLGATGKILGEVFCKNSEISGQIDGKINVEELEDRVSKIENALLELAHYPCLNNFNRDDVYLALRKAGMVRGNKDDKN